jgi:hypothetical protein
LLPFPFLQLEFSKLGGKDILVGASTMQGTMANSFPFMVFIFFFGGSVHTQ